MRLPALATEGDIESPSLKMSRLWATPSRRCGATANGFRSRPDRPAGRLAASGKWSVVNVGIGDNRLPRCGAGPDALALFDRHKAPADGLRWPRHRGSSMVTAAAAAR